jgi:radical SAM-linked protein
MIARFRFAKLGKVRWISQRDVARIWERALRRARLPVSYTGGFSPRPELSFGLALPTGCESTAEYVDVSLDGRIEADLVAGRVSCMLPKGIDVLACAEPQSDLGSLQKEVSSCTWEISVPARAPEDLRELSARVMAAPSLMIERERKGRLATDDLRPSLLALDVLESKETYQPYEARDSSRARRVRIDDDDHEGSGPTLVAELGTRPRGVRPSELARVMGIELGLARRTRQWIDRDGSKFEPLELRAAVAAGERSVS